MRVAVRRIRVALDVFRPGLKDKPSRRLAKRLKVLGARLGQLREVDVLLEGLETYESRGAGRSRQLRPLRSYWTARQGKAHARVVAHLESEAFIEDCAAVETFLLDPPRAALKKVRAVAPRDEIRLAAPNLLFRAWGDVRAADPSWDSVTFAELHRLRLAIKVTRYTLEFLSDILGEETPSLLRQLRRLQDGLGGFTDADVACQRVQTFLSDWTETQKGVAPTARPHPQPVVRYLAVCHSRRHAALVRVEAMWRKFPHDRFRRRLAQAASAA
jgi:CHAD domain-containing protein